MLLGSRALVDEARVWLRRFGGNLFTLTPYALSAMAAYHRNRDSFARRWATTKLFAEAVTAAAASVGASALVRVGPGGPPTCSLVHVHLKGFADDLNKAMLAAAAKTGFKVFRVLRPVTVGQVGEGWSYFEWNIGECNGRIPPKDVQLAWASFFSFLVYGGH
jgi:hypothetical protein